LQILNWIKKKKKWDEITLSVMVQGSRGKSDVMKRIKKTVDFLLLCNNFMCTTYTKIWSMCWNVNILREIIHTRSQSINMSHWRELILHGWVSVWYTQWMNWYVEGYSRDIERSINWCWRWCW
jgi:hypothetical protein